MGAIDFASRIPRHRRQAIERLLFFNGCQDRVAQDIIDVIDRYGPPEVSDDGEGLRVRLPSKPEAQCLFAIERDTQRPIGVAVHVRVDHEHVTVVHLCVAEDYCAGGINESLNLPLRLVREVRRSSRRIKGVRSLEVAYSTQRARAASSVC